MGKRYLGSASETQPSEQPPAQATLAIRAAVAIRAPSIDEDPVAPGTQLEEATCAPATILGQPPVFGSLPSLVIADAGGKL